MAQWWWWEGQGLKLMSSGFMAAGCGRGKAHRSAGGMGAKAPGPWSGPGPSLLAIIHTLLRFPFLSPTSPNSRGQAE